MYNDKRKQVVKRKKLQCLPLNYAAFSPIKFCNEIFAKITNIESITNNECFREKNYPCGVEKSFLLLH